MKNIIIYTDGASRGNPGLGAWAAVLIEENTNKYLEVGGSKDNVTNNQMELKGAIEAIKYLRKRYSVKLYSDSSYLVKGMNEWVSNWIKKNWIKSDKKPVENKELWEELILVSKKQDISFYWVKGHNGNIHNERADKIANILMDEHKKTKKETSHYMRGEF